MPKARMDFTGAEKVTVLREHLIEKRPISDVCEKRGLQPTLSYPWQKRRIGGWGGVVRERRCAWPTAAFLQPFRLGIRSA
jgi:transposase-like protein